MFVRTTKVAVVPKVADAPASKPSSGGGGLVVEKNTGQADAAKAWDEQVRAQLRKEAQAQAATLAKAMQADAQRKAEVEKLFEAMRKRGSAQ
jgi:hypothetical protein